MVVASLATKGVNRPEELFKSSDSIIEVSSQIPQCSLGGDNINCIHIAKTMIRNCLNEFLICDCDREKLVVDMNIMAGEAVSNAYKYKFTPGEAYVACGIVSGGLLIVCVNNCRNENDFCCIPDDPLRESGRGVKMMQDPLIHSRIQRFFSYPTHGNEGLAIVAFMIESAS